jgi:hypothetical protein
MHGDAIRGERVVEVLYPDVPRVHFMSLLWPCEGTPASLPARETTFFHMPSTAGRRSFTLCPQKNPAKAGVNDAETTESSRDMASRCGKNKIHELKSESGKMCYFVSIRSDILLIS